GRLRRLARGAGGGVRRKEKARQDGHRALRFPHGFRGAAAADRRLGPRGVHRAVLGRRGIDSFDDVYRFQFGASSIAVSHVRDEDLIALKRDHPADLVRLDEAGIEAEQALVRRLEKEEFFGDSRAWHLPLYWLVKLGTQDYVASGVARTSDEETDRSIREE